MFSSLLQINVLLLFQIIIFANSGSGHPLEHVDRDQQHDRVGDVPAVIHDGRVHFEYANSTYNQQANIAGSSVAGIAFPSESTNTFTTEHSRSEPSIDFPDDTDELESNGTVAVNADLQNSSRPPGSSDTRKPIVTFPSSSWNHSEKGDDEVEMEISTTSSTTPESSFELYMPTRPLREPDGILIPSIDAAGKPLCLRDPSDTFCESVSDYPK